MIKRFGILLLLFKFTLLSYSQEENSLLWEISGNGLSQNSYVFGTMHLIKKKDFFITDIVKEKLKHSQSFITEIDMDIPFSKQLEIAKRMYLPEGKTLKDYLSEEDFSLFKTIVIDSLNLKESKFEKYTKLKPFFLSALLTKQTAGRIKAYEKELYKIAKNKGIQSDGLESFDFQFSLVDATPIEEQARSLLNEIKNFRQSEQLLNEMVEYYKQQDLSKIYSLIVTGSDSNSEFNENYIFNRNKKWIPLIEEKIKSKSCFIAVGAAHLPGENGILNLLKKQGYTVLPIK